ncbi:uncharacterized protein LOC125492686 [Beta vulgaris subsp. vulgaris]|uniref:uncharacterized protein LOC125492686 n=1 Tax=Beta vulgaris subsp. vulgaris TaxID=3555 RepID=UPI00203687E6|nr:uncharacterized protein LOC125492686 [Beta vulgaris subsp. vulgaris]
MGVYVDSCFLKTFLGGQLLSAVGRDINDQMYPIAWAVVEGENNSSWEWFFKHLQACLALGDGTEYSVVSDEHQAILNVVATVLSKAEHRHCARHIYAHWNKNYKGDEFKKLFWNISFSYNMADYNENMAELEKVNEATAIGFRSYNPKVFSRAFMKPDTKSDSITNNIAETFNGYIINASIKHLIHMLEDTRAQLMQRLVQKRVEMEKCTTVLCHRIQKKLEKEKETAANCNVLHSSTTLFQINHNLDSLTVDLEKKSCTCRKWNMTGIPCCHAISAIFFSHMQAEDFVDACYKKDTWAKAYACSILPLEGERHWPRVEVHLDPPPIKIGPGRPRKNRIKAPHEDPKKPGTLW